MALNFSKHGPTDTSGVRYGAIGYKERQKFRFLIEKHDTYWRADVQLEVNGQGFVSFYILNAKTLKAAKAKCEEFLNPTPIGESTRTDG